MGLFRRNKRENETEQGKKARADVLLKELDLYKNEKTLKSGVIMENERWFNGQYWEYISSRNEERDAQTNFLFSAIWHKHADAMDNYPEPIFLEREEGDREEADKLSKIVPLVLEKNGFENVYSDLWWYKLKHGVSICSVLWDNAKEDGLGDICIKKVDALRFFAEPYISDIQQSRYVFVTALADTDVLKRQYGDPDIRPDATASKARGYFGDYSPNVLEKKTMVVDCYQRYRDETGKYVVHLEKIINGRIMYDSRQDPVCINGIYEHGMYPFVLDVFIPIENSIYGLGMIDIGKKTQSYIDKLDYIIEENALLSGRQRWLIKRGAGIKTEDFLDMSKTVIEADGSIDSDAVRDLQAQPIPSQIMTHRTEKIEEIKELLGNRDFSQGATSGGVTAYGAITALQEAGSKLARDGIKASYRAFAGISYMVVELIRQFYTEERSFRILGDGETEPQYISYDNSVLQGQSVPLNVPITLDDGTVQTERFRKAIFDIKIVAQRKNPFNTISHNQMVMELFSGGAFNPDNADQAILALQNMIMDNKESMIEGIRENQIKNAQLYQQLQAQDAQLKRMTAIVNEMTNAIPGQAPGLEAVQP